MDTNMGILDLAEIMDTVSWHENNDHKHPGIFIKLPRSLAAQYPKIKDDESPKHISIVLLDNIDTALEDKLVNVIQQVCSKIKPFSVKIGKVGKFVNDENKIILHSKIKSNKLFKFHDVIKQALSQNQFSVSNKYPNFDPHVTIQYCDDKKEAKQYKDVQPEGEFMVDHIEIWGTSKPYYVLLK